MSSSKRLTSLEGLSSAATKIDNEHNLCVNKYHHVSSDGVLFTVSADTLRHLHALWDMAQSASGSEVVLSDEDFEHAKSVRLPLDLLVQGVVGRKDRFLDHVPDAIDLTLKYDCRCGYALCLAFTEQVFARLTKSPSPIMCEILILAGELDEVRLGQIAVRAIETQLKTNKPDYQFWSLRFAVRLNVTYLCAMLEALAPPVD